MQAPWAMLVLMLCARKYVPGLDDGGAVVDVADVDLRSRRSLQVETVEAVWWTRSSGRCAVTVDGSDSRIAATSDDRGRDASSSILIGICGELMYGMAILGLRPPEA